MHVPTAWAVALLTAGVLLVISLCVGGMLVVGAFRDRRTVDLGIYVAGLGAAWVLLLGSAILGDFADPAVHGSPLALPWLVAGASLLVAGLIVTARGLHSGS